MPEGRRKPESRPIVLESGIEVKPVYGPEDIADLDVARDLGRPGEYPYTRGIHPLMYRARPFTMRQYAGFGTARETNERFRYLISHGQNALNVALDLPTQMGLDSDDPRARGEVGRVGMAVDSLRDFEEAFEGIDLAKISTSITINAISPIFIAMYLAVAERQEVPAAELRGTTQNDILKEYIGRGTWIFPVEPSLRLIGDTVEYCARHLPRYNPVSICGYHIRESGANPAQEMAYALCIARAYARTFAERGLAADEFAPKLTFNFDIHGNLFEQVAKFRAGRRLYARMMRDEFGARERRSLTLRMIAGGGGGGLTREEPLNNIARGAFYALASALSGTQTMALCCYDEAYTIPSEEAARVALRTMQIVAEETGVGDTVDPLAGSYYVEWLTNRMEERIREYMDEVERMGGMVRAVESGAVQRLVAAQAYEHHRRVERGEEVKVGVAREAAPETAPSQTTTPAQDVAIYRHDPEIARQQAERLAQLRRERQGAQVKTTLDDLAAAARTDANLMEPTLAAVRAYATVGEITQVLKEAFGEFREPPLF